MSAPDRRAAVLLDLDDTILDFHWAEHRALSGALRELGLEPTPAILDRYSEINIRQWEKLEEGLLTREQVLLVRFEILFDELGLSLSGERARDLYEERLSHGHRFIDGAPELLEALHGPYRLYLASNGSTLVQKGRLASAGIGPYFDGVFLSEELGCDKPQRGFFEACFARIPDFDPARALMVGDSLTSDIRGGLNAGLRTCWFNPKGKPPRPDIRADHEIRRLSELPPLLERLFPD